MKLALVGHGKMGKLIEQIAKDKGHSVVTIDPTSQNATYKEINEESVKDADVVIDFTSPDTLMDNVKKITALKKNLLVGTTGWYENIDEVKSIVESSGVGFLYATNFSVGMNIFLRIVEQASKLVNNIDEYDPFGYELHHNQKADSPSGTAKSVAEAMLNNIERKTELNYDRVNRKIEPSELHYGSIRAGSIPGTHVAAFDSEADTIELKHTARNRNGFALGAVIAAQWLNGKKGFFEMKDFMDEFFSK